MSEVRYVTVPATVTVELQAGTGVDVSFAEFLRERTADAVFGTDLDAIMLAVEIRQSFLGSAPGGVVGLQLPAWEALCKAIRKPTVGYNPAVMIQLIDYARAVIDAPSKAPARATE